MNIFHFAGVLFQYSRGFSTIANIKETIVLLGLQTPQIVTRNRNLGTLFIHVLKRPFVAFRADYIHFLMQ